MKTYTYLVAGLASFDLLLLIGLYRYLRSHAPVDPRVLIPVAAGLIGFAVHAFLFFRGAFLIVQVTTIASIFGVYLFCSLRHRKA
jgi:hypothetical protein